MADRGLDIRGLEPVLERPIEILDEAANGGEDLSKLAAHWVILNNRLMWHKRSIEALERAAAASPKWRERLRAFANKVRGNLAGEWKTD